MCHMLFSQIVKKSRKYFLLDYSPCVLMTFITNICRSFQISASLWSASCILPKSCFLSPGNEVRLYVHLLSQLKRAVAPSLLEYQYNKHKAGTIPSCPSL